MKKILFASVLALGFSGLAGLTNVSTLQAQETQVIRLGHPNGLAHHMGRTLTKMAEEVRASTGGRISIEQERAGPETALADVKNGKLDAAGIATFYWTAEGAVGGLDHAIPEMDLLMIPYQLTDIEKLKRFPTSALAKQMETRGAAAGVHPLMWIFITNTAIITSMKKPILEPSDLNGLRMRSLRGFNEAMFQLAGATPTPMPPSAFGKWISDGNGDGGTTDVYAAAHGNWAETQKYGTIAPLYSVFYLIFVNQKVWDLISPADQRAIEAAARSGEQSDFDLAEQADKEAIEKLRAGGMTLHMQTPDERKHWQAAFVGPLTKTFLQQVPGGQKLLDLAKRL